MICAFKNNSMILESNRKMLSSVHLICTCVCLSSIHARSVNKAFYAAVVVRSFLKSLIHSFDRLVKWIVLFLTTRMLDLLFVMHVVSKCMTTN